MDDFSQVLTGLLESPEGLDKIKSLASMFLAGDDDKAKPQSSGSDLMGGFDPSILLKVQSIMGKMNNSNDKRIILLNALRPYLNAKRVESMDNALKLLKFSQMAMVLGDDFKL